MKTLEKLENFKLGNVKLNTVMGGNDPNVTGGGERCDVDLTGTTSVVTWTSDYRTPRGMQYRGEKWSITECILEP